MQNLTTQTTPPERHRLDECAECDKEIFEGMLCDGCERCLCERCFKLHDCAFHNPEIVLCTYCEADCEMSAGKLPGHETRPAMINGDPVCAKCAYFKPWEIKPLSHFEKAG